jgi:hypothetical protein
MKDLATGAVFLIQPGKTMSGNKVKHPPEDYVKISYK